MAQLLAIEWDVREARVAIGRTRGKEITIEQAIAIPFGSREAPNSLPAQRITEALQPYGLGRVDTLVAIGRANIELRQLSLPPAPANELPELVRFQALRQFTTIGEDWPLDFVPLAGPEGETESINVLAAAVSPELIRQIQATCEAARLNPKRIVLRPFAAASLLRRRDAGSVQPCRLMVDLLAEEADLTVLDGERLVVTRSVRLGSAEDRDLQARGLLGEIRRTIAAANSQLSGRRVEKVVFCGDGSEHTVIRTLVEQELALAVEVFDPYSGLRLGAALQSQRPENAGRFAPLLGLLLDEAAATPHAIDFLHPRKKQEPVDLRRRNLLIAATLGVMVLAAGWLIMMQLSSLDDEIVMLRAKSASMKRDLAAAEKTRKEAAIVQEFLDHNVNWLDELYLLAEQLPPPDDVVVTQASFTVTQPRGGQLRIEGFTRQPTQFQQVEERLRAAKRAVISETKPNDDKRDTHKFGFLEIVKVPPRNETSTLVPAAKGTAAKGTAAKGTGAAGTGAAGTGAAGTGAPAQTSLAPGSTVKEAPASTNAPTSSAGSPLR